MPDKTKAGVISGLESTSEGRSFYSKSVHSLLLGARTASKRALMLASKRCIITSLPLSNISTTLLRSFLVEVERIVMFDFRLKSLNSPISNKHSVDISPCSAIFFNNLGRGSVTPRSYLLNWSLWIPINSANCFWDSSPLMFLILLPISFLKSKSCI